MNKIVLCLVMFLAASVSFAATNRIVPTTYATIQAAVDAADSGDTVTITNSATYSGGLKVTKPLNIVAEAGQTPMIQSASGTTTPTLLFDTNSGGTKFGSLTGGRINVNYVKDPSATAVVPTGMVKFQQSTGTLVTVENVLIDESGPASGDGLPITNIIHEKDIKNSVNLNYVDIITSRTQTANINASACGIVIGIGSYTGASYTPYVTNQGGPNYNLDHVRIKHYTIVGLMPTITSTTLNMSYCDIGVLGDYGRYVNDAGRPWGSLNQNGVCAASLFSNIDHSVLRGSRAGHNVNLSGAGSSISLTRSVLINDYYINSGPHGNLFFFGGLTAYSPGLPCKVVADHCDIVCKSTGATIGSTTYPQVKKNYWAILRTTNTTTQAQNMYPDCTIKNSNIYSDYNNLIQFQMVHPTDKFVTQNCNVYTGGTDKPSINYTPGTGDLSMDPMYEDYGSVDLRYKNNTLKTADDQGKPIGVNAGYGDVVAGIVPGTEGVINRAQGWTTLK